MNGAPIVLCKNLAFVGAVGDVLILDWVGFDASYLNADFVVEAKTFETGTVRFILQTSTDGAVTSSLGQTDLAAVGRTPTAITSGLLPLVRLTLTAQGAATRAVVSAYLVPKHD
jgi:hypothetical protein